MSSSESDGETQLIRRRGQRFSSIAQVEAAIQKTTGPKSARLQKIAELTNIKQKMEDSRRRSRKRRKATTDSEPALQAQTALKSYIKPNCQPPTSAQNPATNPQAATEGLWLRKPYDASSRQPKLDATDERHRNNLNTLLLMSETRELRPMISHLHEAVEKDLKGTATNRKRKSGTPNQAEDYKLWFQRYYTQNASAPPLYTLQKIQTPTAEVAAPKLSFMAETQNILDQEAALLQTRLNK